MMFVLGARMQTMWDTLAFARALCVIVVVRVRLWL